MEFTILLPCLNEEKTVAVCIRQAAAFFEKYRIDGEVLVVDNGSTDASPQIAVQEGARVILCREKGYGNALRCGIGQALGAYVIMGDCDCSYHFDDLMPFVTALRDGAELVVGNRFAIPMEQGAMSPSHQIGVPFLSWLGRLRYHCDVRDFHCGLRAVCKESFLKLNCQAEGMEFATEMIGRAALSGQRISQLPVRLYRDQRGGSSHLRTVRDGLRHVRVMLSGWQEDGSGKQ